jgi:hypothetical protein
MEWRTCDSTEIIKGCESMSINAIARERANQACARLTDELASLAAAYGEASKNYHQVWAKVYSEERKRALAVRENEDATT